MAQLARTHWSMATRPLYGQSTTSDEQYTISLFPEYSAGNWVQ